MADWKGATPDQVMDDFVGIVVGIIGPTRDTPEMRNRIKQLALEGHNIRTILRKLPKA